MIFYLALTIMVLYTLIFFYVDLRDYLNKGGVFGEGMENMVPKSTDEVKNKTQNIINSNPNLKMAVQAGKPDFMKGVMNAMPSLMSAYTKSKTDLDKAQPHMKKAQPHLQAAFKKAQPDLKVAFDNSFNDFNEAYQKSRSFLGAEVTSIGNKMQGVSDQPVSVTENVISTNKHNNLTNAAQSTETPIETREFDIKDPKFSRLSNGLIAKHGNGMCPNGCLAPQYDNDLCANEIFQGKAYRSCPWVSDGRIDNNACNDCGAILIPKNRFGYARTRPGLFTEKALKMALKSCEFDKNDNNIDYLQVGIDFMDDLARIKNFRVPNFKDSDYVTIGRIVYKYDMDKLNTSIYKDKLTSTLNKLLNTHTLEPPLLNKRNKYLRKKPCGKRYKDTVKERELKHIMGDLKYQSAVDGAIEEMKSDNRLGGSKTAYTKNYKPIDPNKFPRPYDSIWSH